MNYFADYNLEQANKYHSWYESGKGKTIGYEQREVLRINLGDVRGRRLLDVGCGTGYFTSWFNQIGFCVVGIDSSEAMLQVAREKYGEGIEFMFGDAAQLPFGDRSFDVVVFAMSLEFTADAGAVIREAKRVAASEIMLAMLNPDNPRNEERIKNAESEGGVFLGAQLMRPEVLARLFKDDGLWSGSLVVESEHSPYYILKMVRKETGVINCG
jgi:ubiquinone/menaquinone biosynthesis C-methylase UbiE